MCLSSTGASNSSSLLFNLERSPSMALQRTRRPRIRSGLSLRSLGSSLNARPLGRSEEV
jgi:hypothetical protein